MHAQLALIVAIGCGAPPTPMSPEPISCEPRAGEVVLFDHGDYAGSCAPLALGDYPFPSTMQLANDTASSILVGSGARALACTAHDFTGECTYIDRSTPALERNDTMSSVRVEPLPVDCTPGPAQIALFDEPGFAGACVVLGIGDFPRSWLLGIANDAVSSVRVGPGAQALLCAGDGWEEPCAAIATDREQLALNDVVSSVRVLRAGTDCVMRGNDEHASAWEAACSRAHAEILALLETAPQYTLPITVTWDHLATFAAETRGRDIFLDEGAIDPSDKRVLYHELAHVITRYADTPLWLAEGIADWIRGELTGWSDIKCRGADTYAIGYQCAAVMLDFIDAQDPGAIVGLYRRLRTERYDGLIGGREIDAWWRACVAAGPCRPG
jgi:hypothetical protein